MRSRFQTLIGFIAFAAVAGLVIWAFIEAVQADPAVVGSVGVAVVGVLGVVWQQNQAEKARVREAHRDRMEPVYYDLLGVVFKKIAGGGASGSDPEVEEFFKDLKARQLTLGASSKMVRSFNDWTRSTSQAQEEGDEVGVVLAWEALLRAIREDLGHNDADLPPRELLRLFITDFDEHFSTSE